jgi:transcriptional regulator with XRE-family HTH domain
MKTRILEFLKTENKSSAQFADEIGVQPSSISHIISGRNNPSLDFVMKMLTKYPSLSTDWLLFGRGMMYREPQLNDLFSLASNDLTDRGSDGGDDDLSLQMTGNPLKASVAPGKQDPDPVSIQSKRIVFFFADGTFKEYLPR